MQRSRAVVQVVPAPGGAASRGSPATSSARPLRSLDDYFRMRDELLELVAALRRPPGGPAPQQVSRSCRRSAR